MKMWVSNIKRIIKLVIILLSKRVGINQLTSTEINPDLHRTVQYRKMLNVRFLDNEN